jgi:hypothetical protein
LVWSKPKSDLARSLDISDVALAKLCRGSNVPAPPRGRWARLSASKPIRIASLPPRFPGSSDIVGGESRLTAELLRQSRRYEQAGRIRGYVRLVTTRAPSVFDSHVGMVRSLEVALKLAEELDSTVNGQLSALAAHLTNKANK